MHLLIAAVGRLKAGAERELAIRYRDRARRVGRAIGVRSIELGEIDESRARRPADRLVEENLGFRRIVPENAAIVALDADGDALSSKDLATHLGRWRDQGKPTTAFLIGGADGLALALKRNAELRLSFGAATWPHQLVRIMYWSRSIARSPFWPGTPITAIEPVNLRRPPAGKRTGRRDGLFFLNAPVL